MAFDVRKKDLSLVIYDLGMDTDALVCVCTNFTDEDSFKQVLMFQHLTPGAV